MDWGKLLAEKGLESPGRAEAIERAQQRSAEKAARGNGRRKPSSKKNHGIFPGLKHGADA